MAEYPPWVPPAAPPTPAPPTPTVQDAEWMDYEIEGEGEHTLWNPTHPKQRLWIFYAWIGNLGEAECRVGFRWASQAQPFWNRLIAYLDGAEFNPPKPRIGLAGDPLVIRVVGTGARLSVSLLAFVEATTI